MGRMSWLINSVFMGDWDDVTFDPIYLEMAAQGQSFFQASGDNGSYNWSDPAQDHADDPNITLVGGTPCPPPVRRFVAFRNSLELEYHWGGTTAAAEESARTTQFRLTNSASNE